MEERGTARSNESRFDAEEKQILLFTGVAHALTHYVELTYPVLAIFIASEAALPVEVVVSWSLAGYALFGFGALPAGYLADRIGCRSIVVVGIGTAGLAAIAAGFASPGWPIAVCLAFAGLGVSTYHPAGMGLISRAVRARGTALGINGIYGNIGIALTAVTTSALAAWLGWRSTFVITGVLLLTTAALGALLPFREPPPAEAPTEASRDSPVPVLQIITFLILCSVAMLGGFAYRANTVSLPKLSVEYITSMDFGLAVSLAFVSGTVAQYIAGRIADRFPLGWGYFAFHLCSLPAVFLMTIATDLSLLASASLYAFFALGMQPLENSLFAQLTPDRWRSTAYGLKFTLTFGIGSSAVLMVNRVAGTSGWVGVYQVLTGIVALIVLLALAVALLSRRIGQPGVELPAGAVAAAE